jgi:energy-coupling factor transporter ATP-binding protein EcfA2
MNLSDSLVIETRHLSKAYKGVQALKDLNLAVRQHSIFGFLGPNGAGKTTTIKLLLGLVRPTSGSAQIFGYDIQKDSLLYLASALMLGVLTSNRGVLLGVSLGVLLIGFLAVPLGAAIVPAMMLTPWTLIHILPSVVQGAPLPLPVWLPIGVTAILSGVCVAVTLAKFGRLEF